MELSAKTRKWGAVLLALLFGIGFAAVLFLPYPKEVGAGNDVYTIRWSDGSTTSERYGDAVSCLQGLTSGGDVLLEKEGKTGTYVSENAEKEGIAALEAGDLLPMLTMGPFSRLFSAALYRVYVDRLYFSEDEWFRFDGEKVVPSAIGKAGTVFVSDGKLPASLLISTEATKLILGDLAEFSYETIYGTKVSVEGKTRYIVENGAIVDTDPVAGLVAGEPLASRIVVPDVPVCEEGALLPCRQLTELDLPFVGSGPVAAGELFYGELGYLFTEGGEYFVPKSLTRVRVRGGALVSFAFYHCPSVEEIDACGVAADAIEKQAFAGLPALKRLHTPRADVELSDPEKFTTYVADCGCTVYEIKEK